MVDSKTVAVIVLLLVVAFGGGINYILEKTSLDTKVASAFDNPTGFVTKLMPSSSGKELRIYAELAYDMKPSLSVKVSEPMKTFAVDYTDEKATVALGSFTVNSPSPVQMEFREYTGGVTAIENILSFAGSSGQIKYNAEYMTQANPIKVKGDGIKFSKIELTGVPKTALHLTNMTGTITVTEGASKSVNTVSDAEVTLDTFRGKISLSGTSLILDGSGILRTGMLLAPGR